MSIIKIGIINSRKGSSITGGIITFDGDYTIHTFGTAGTDYLEVKGMGDDFMIDQLIIGAGGLGGETYSNIGSGGGGGGGQFQYLTTQSLVDGSHEVITGDVGGSSSFNGVTSTAGLSGLKPTYLGIARCRGGSGGASSSGMAGGIGFYYGRGVGDRSTGGGGGGSTGVGQAGYEGSGGSGGAGTVNSISGSSVEYCKGGRGGGKYYVDGDVGNVSTSGLGIVILRYLTP